MKKIAPKSLYVGQLVALNNSNYAQVYTVAEVDELTVTVMWLEGSRLCSHCIDASLCFYPRLEQIEYSINNNGRLATVQDLVTA
jgi:hypothetical protein